eukprot:TRINITY_DN1130_c0_g1_i1.p1 TRINITY_DN1130_c0_g1~~TRINITY_DN1130_c0_g1_i1.p1  ORF type:complete len:476 (-),score=109.16 TRINITY_DN1130_c0_g1_i1:702-2129(-)
MGLLSPKKNGIHTKLLETPNLDKLSKYHSETHGSFNFPVGVCFSINVIIGCGVLGIPWAFHKGGYFLASVSIAVLCFLAVVVKDFLLDCMARAEAVKQFELYAADQKVDLEDQRVLKAPPAFKMTSRKFEIAELANIFMGRKASVAFVVIFCAYGIGTLWAYVSIFAKGFSDTFPLIDGWSYHIYWLGFTIAVVTLTCMEMKEQLIVQVIMSILRFVILFLIIGTSLIPMLNGHQDFTDIEHSHENDAPFADFGGLGQLLPVIGVAQILHHVIPTIANDVKNKKHVSPIFNTAFLLSGGLYLAVGVVVSLYFGDQIKSSCNLNWNSYTGPLIIQRFIVLFPGIDVLSAYPLAAIALASNIMSVCERRVDKAQNSRWQVTKYRIIASLPPAIGAYFISDLGVILSFSGLFAFVIFAYPCFTFWFAFRKSIKIWGIAGRKTPFSTYICRPKYALIVGYTIVVLALIALVAQIDKEFF